MPLPFDCDHCKQDTEGDVYQDKTGNIFVCEDCFNSSNDGEYFIEPKKEDVK